jgi:hypothetical protein
VRCAGRSKDVAPGGTYLLASMHTRDKRGRYPRECACLRARVACVCVHACRDAIEGNRREGEGEGEVEREGGGERKGEGEGRCVRGGALTNVFVPHMYLYRTGTSTTVSHFFHIALFRSLR